MEPERKRVLAVLLKLARGHSLFELNEPKFDSLPGVAWAPLSTLTDAARTAFESPPANDIWPEVGSRASQPGDRRPRVLALADSSARKLQVPVQRGPRRVGVRFVIREYLACEAIWRD